MFNKKKKEEVVKVQSKKDFTSFIEEGKETLRKPNENFREWAERLGVDSEKVQEFKSCWLNR